jgi:hypothetical protein
MAAVSGSTVLQELDSGLSSLRSDLRSMDSAVMDSGMRMQELGEAKLALYKRLARHRLAQLERGDVIRGLDTVSHYIHDLLGRRESEHRSLLSAIRDAEARLEDLEAQRDQLRMDVESADTALDEREADVQARLENDPAYNAQLERAREADAVADQAETKMQDAVDDRNSKGKPYETDTLFMYLWRRSYGTSEYRSNPLTKLLDGWVARLCDYDKSRPNYWMLNEIPRRLESHAERERASADAEFEKLKQIEATTAEEMGVSRLRQNLEAKEQSLAELDESIASVEGEIAELGTERARYASGEDELMTQALDRIAAEMKADGIEALRRRAALTPDHRDDLIVQEIADVDDRLEFLLEEHRDRQKVHRRRTQKVRELERLRQKFKQRGYDDMRSIFMDGTAVAGALQQFLGGLLDGDDLWRIIARTHRLRQVRARPNFGSGGFPHRRGSWRRPRSASPFPRPQLPRGGGLRFPSGGGLRRPGGGGFSTGGGF